MNNGFFDLRQGKTTRVATNEQARQLDIKLEFLPKGSYEATIV